MKRAQAHEVRTAFFELHITTHDFNDVSSRDELLYKSLRNSHSKYCGPGFVIGRNDAIHAKEVVARRPRIGVVIPFSDR